jgi:CRP-like cAMP-binding protein
MLGGLGPLGARIVVLVSRIATARAGSHLATRGETRDELYVLLDGRAEVRGEDGRVLAVLGRGDVTGEMGALRRRPRTADVVATEDTEYLVIDERFLQRLRRRYPRLAATVFLNLTRILSDRLETTTGELASEARAARTA